MQYLITNGRQMDRQENISMTQPCDERILEIPKNMADSLGE